VEAAVENMEIKKRAFAELDGVCKADAILATNTSSLSIRGNSRRHETAGQGHRHAFLQSGSGDEARRGDPGLSTSDETKRNTIVDLCSRLGKTPVEVNEAPGFVVNGYSYR
jgi:3-hydroxybutyryl-CoA dehydrogenase